MLIIRRSKLYYTASGTITPVGGRPVRRLREDHVEAFNKYKTSFCASSWLITRKDYVNEKFPMTPSGIEPVTFRFVAHHLNHCAMAVPT